jgi:Na+-transporting methylmalonyl-CoA/oxaloacetate decarboxylase gamma subunit
MRALLSENFITSLEIMGKGMLSVFVVILLLTFIVILLAKITGREKKKNAGDEA